MSREEKAGECFPIEVPQLLSSSLQKLIIMCLTEGDDRDPSKVAVKASSSALLVRILVMNTNYLAQLTSDPSLFTHLQKFGFPSEENILLCLVDVWLEKLTSDPSLFTHLQKSGFPSEENILLCLVDVWLEKVQICEPGSLRSQLSIVLSKVLKP
ncbi:hypothetical protein BC332_23407 [Capsicum chinense]|nr:hypothetical protein BC332_23407 [Capsicum chinense]